MKEVINIEYRIEKQVVVMVNLIIWFLDFRNWFLGRMWQSLNWRLKRFRILQVEFNRFFQWVIIVKECIEKCRYGRYIMRYQRIVIIMNCILGYLSYIIKECSCIIMFMLLDLSGVEFKVKGLICLVEEILNQEYIQDFLCLLFIDFI